MTTAAPKIGICAMPLEGGSSGIGVYIRQMVSKLSRSPDLRLIVFGFHDERDLLDIGANAIFVPVGSSFRPVLRNIFWHGSMLPLLASRHRLDLLFLPAGNRRMSRMLIGHRCKVAATIHDLAPFHIPDKYDSLRMHYVRRILPPLWRATPLLIAPSRFTANDLKKLVGLPSAGIRVIHNGVEHSAYRPMPRGEARELALETTGLPERFILYVARIEHPGKNHVGLLRGYARLLERKPDLEQHLVFVGADWNGADEVRAEVRKLGLSEKVWFTGVASAEALPYIYAASDLFAFPSLFEGFGIPAIEAMAAGVPVVASDRSSLPEIMGEKGLLFDPESADIIADTLQKGLFDDEFRAQEMKRGPRHAAKFSWEASAAETARTLIELLEKG